MPKAEAKKKEKKELTPAQKARRALNYSINQYRAAVRWLRDVRVYRNTFSGGLTMEGKTWKNDIEGELAQDAQTAYDEAASAVLYWRKQVNQWNKKSLELVEKEKKEKEKKEKENEKEGK